MQRQNVLTNNWDTGTLAWVRGTLAVSMAAVPTGGLALADTVPLRTLMGIGLSLFWLLFAY